MNHIANMLGIKDSCLKKGFIYPMRVLRTAMIHGTVRAVHTNVLILALKGVHAHFFQSTTEREACHPLACLTHGQMPFRIQSTSIALCWSRSRKLLRNLLLLYFRKSSWVRHRLWWRRSFMQRQRAVKMSTSSFISVKWLRSYIKLK